MDEAPWPSGRGVLQLARGGDFYASRSRHRSTRVATPTRGPEAEGDPLAAPSTCLRLQCPDLAGVVGAFPRSATDGILADLSFGNRNYGSRSRRRDGALGRLFEWRKRTWLANRDKLANQTSGAVSDECCGTRGEGRRLSTKDVAGAGTSAASTSRCASLPPIDGTDSATVVLPTSSPILKKSAKWRSQFEQFLVTFRL